jgi:nicotinate-nucleotide adenylyltransferase
MHRIGIFSGTFDPVHAGHLAFALETRRICGLEQVIFLAERSPRDKTAVTDINHRVALLQAATADQSDLAVMELSSPQFTVAETLPELRRQLPDTELTLLIGSDVVRTFSYRWPGLETLLSEVSLAIGMRAGDARDEITAILSQLEADLGAPVRHTFIDTPAAAVTSSQSRKGPADPSHLQPAILSYIEQHGLYV